jgi:hypothetical protein
MKNIYNIITEQKAFVDFNISKYDLEYTISQFENNDYYLQEGLGESIQNAGRKVIEFIKKIISKIRDMVRAVINIFRKNTDPIKKLEAKIDMANKVLDAMPGGGGGSSSNGGKSPQEQMDEITKKNQEKREQEIKDMEKKRREKEEEYEKRREEFVKNSDQPFKTGAGIKIDSLQGLLSESLYKFSYYERRGDIQKRIDFVKDFMTIFNMTYSHSESVLVRHPARILRTDSSYLVNRMNQSLFSEEDVDINEALADVLGDYSVPNGSGAMQAHVYSYADHIYDYLQGGREFAAMVDKFGKSSEQTLKKIIDSLEKQEKMVGMSDELTNAHFSRLSIIFQKFSNYVAKVTHYLISTTMSEYKHCVEIAQVVTTHYCRMMS